jgi:hypothetical protein
MHQQIAQTNPMCIECIIHGIGQARDPLGDLPRQQRSVSQHDPAAGQGILCRVK